MGLLEGTMQWPSGSDGRDKQDVPSFEQKGETNDGPIMTVRIDQSASTKFMWFETVDELEVLGSVFGDGFLCNRRKRKPRIGEPLLLNTNDALNVVTSECGEKEQFLKRTKDNGVDLTFDGCSELRIAVRYERHIFRADSELIGKVGQFIYGNSPSNSEDEDDSLQINDKFPMNGIMYTVADIRGATAYCVTTLPDGSAGAQVAIDLDTATSHFIAYYNN
jgi:hypothetical protein